MPIKQISNYYSYTAKLKAKIDIDMSFWMIYSVCCINQWGIVKYYPIRFNSGEELGFS